jgi:hypothetical protein
MTSNPPSTKANAVERLRRLLALPIECRIAADGTAIAAVF